MASFRTWLSYLTQKLNCSIGLTMEKVHAGELKQKSDTWYNIWKNFVGVRLTYLYRSKGIEMAPSIPGEEELLLVRRVPCLPDIRIRQEYRQVFIGDVIVFKNPLDPDRHLVRRVAADAGQEMVSTDEKDEPFVLNDEELWVLSDNKDLKPVEAKDSRTFGPITITDIVGRVLYRMQSAKDHGPVHNSDENKDDDEAVLQVELDVDQMAKSSKA